MALTPNDVLNKQFQTTKFRDGYDQDEVDDFLDEVLAEFQRLIAENDQLKTQVAAAPAGGGDADALRAQLAEVRSQLAETQQRLKAAQDEAASGSPMLDGMNSAEYLQLARRVHEEHVREGVVKRDEAIAEGESKAAQILADAQAKHDQLVGEAESKAADVTRTAQERADSILGDARTKSDELLAEAAARRETQLNALATEVAALGTERDGLQARIDELTEFERTYRASLKDYLTSQLDELAAVGTAPAPHVAAGEAPAEDAPAEDAKDEPAAPAQDEPALEETSSEPRPAFQWEPPSRSFDAPSATPTAGLGGD